MAIHFPDSTDLERPFFTKISAVSLDIAPTIVMRIDDVGDLTCKHASASCAVFNLYHLSQLYSPIYYLLNSQLFSLI